MIWRWPPANIISKKYDGLSHARTRRLKPAFSYGEEPINVKVWGRVTEKRIKQEPHKKQQEVFDEANNSRTAQQRTAKRRGKTAARLILGEGNPTMKRRRIKSSWRPELGGDGREMQAGTLD